MRPRRAVAALTVSCGRDAYGVLETFVRT